MVDRGHICFFQHTFLVRGGLQLCGLGGIHGLIWVLVLLTFLREPDFLVGRIIYTHKGTAVARENQERERRGGEKKER